MLQVETRALTKLEEKSVRKDEQTIFCDFHLQNDSTFCLAVTSPLHLLSLSLAPKQMKLIPNHLCFLTGQLDIPLKLN